MAPDQNEAKPTSRRKSCASSVAEKQFTFDARNCAEALKVERGGLIWLSLPRSGFTNLARPFKAGKAGPPSPSRSDDRIIPTDSVHRSRCHSPLRTPDTLPGKFYFGDARVDSECIG